MDFSIIDELYNIYKNEEIEYAAQKFEENYYKHQMYGNKDLFLKLQEYIKKETASVANYFVSEKDSSYIEHGLIENIELLFEAVLIPVDDSVTQFVYEGLDLDEIKDYHIPLKLRKPHDLFNMDIKFIEKAVNDDGVYIAEYNQIKDIILYVKKHKLLDKIYKALR